jgi:hypothetical protein
MQTFKLPLLLLLFLVLAGTNVWFQGVDFDMFGTNAMTTTNGVLVVVQ